MHPTEICLNRNRSGLSVTWDNGATAFYPARLLRERARDATSVRLAADGLAVPPPCNLTITSVEPVGNYAVRVAFSDGHDRGIYPWAYLIEIDGVNSTQAVTGY
jgi:DUF971 family protein